MNNQKNDEENGLGWSPMLDMDTGVDANKIKQLDLERKDHRYLQGLAQRIKGIESHWLGLLEKNFAPEVMSQFSHLIREESKLAEAHGFNAIFELTAEIESTLIALGRNPGSYTDSVRAYMDSCVSSLNRTVIGLIDEAVANQRMAQQLQTNSGSHRAPRLYILDTEKETAASLCIDLKGQGFKVFPIVDWQELQRLCKLQKPEATIVVLNQNEDPQRFIEKLRLVVSIDGGSVPCFVMAHSDTPQSRAMVASSGANSFVPLPCYVPALAAQLHSIKHSSLAKPMTLLVVGDEKNQLTQDAIKPFKHGEAEFIFCDKLSQLPYIPNEHDIDGMLVIDTGDDKLLTRCIALVGQDQQLMSLPITVLLRSNHNYSEPMLRLIATMATDVFAKESDKSNILLRLQSRTLQTRRKRFIDDYLKAYDPESGLMVKPAFYEQVKKRLEQNASGVVPGAITYIRLDYLREITEAVGLDKIAEFKKSIAHRMISVLGPDDLVTTLSDNEYVVYSKRDEAAAYRQIEWSVKKQIEQLGQETLEQSKLCARVGVALFKDRDILKTLYTAIGAINIQEEKATSAAATPAPVLTQRMARKASSPIAARVKQAMEDDRLILLFQPIVSMEGDGFERYELLMRMQENGQMLSPAEFLPDDAPANVHRFLDRWVINKALRVMSQTLADRKELKFFIKLNADTVQDEGFVPWLGKVLDVFDAPIERCVFELKEQTLINHFAESQAFINFVRDQGACVCIENFGTRQQSLRLLDYVEVDYLKLHRDYLGAIGTHDERDLRLDSIIEKANQLEVSTLAGFVETTSNLSLALQRGVALFQGYFLQPPQEEMEFDFSMTM